ncbi:MAG: phospho-N-acetylmuramoyl-pentapeptide-transferase [bacterium]
MIFLEIVLYIISFFATYFLIKYYIKYYGSKVGQEIREDAPKHHILKKGTPTAAGVIFIIIPSIISFFILLKLTNLYLALVFIILVIGSMLIGFIDDYFKIINKRNLGLKARQKLLLQFFITLVSFFLIYFSNSFFINNFNLDFEQIKIVNSIYSLNSIGYYLFLFFLVSGVSNATNLTDGLDGLAATLSIITLIGFLIISLILKKFFVISIILLFIFSIFSFLIFNFPKAKVMMGDSGSLSLGALFVFLAIVLKVEPLLLFLGFMFFIVTLSVILQVIYFKITKGNRLFYMTPLHHHYEILGYAEKQILLRFSLLHSLVILIGISILKFY